MNLSQNARAVLVIDRSCEVHRLNIVMRADRAGGIGGHLAGVLVSSAQLAVKELSAVLSPSKLRINWKGFGGPGELCMAPTTSGSTIAGVIDGRDAAVSAFNTESRRALPIGGSSEVGPLVTGNLGAERDTGPYMGDVDPGISLSSRQVERPPRWLGNHLDGWRVCFDLNPENMFLTTENDRLRDASDRAAP